MGTARYHRYIASGTILILGSTAAVAIYFGAGDDSLFLLARSFPER
jgi:hypothetical protein